MTASVEFHNALAAVREIALYGDRFEVHSEEGCTGGRRLYCEVTFRGECRSLRLTPITTTTGDAADDLVDLILGTYSAWRGYRGRDVLARVE